MPIRVAVWLFVSSFSVKFLDSFIFLLLIDWAFLDVYVFVIPPEPVLTHYFLNAPIDLTPKDAPMLTNIPQLNHSGQSSLKNLKPSAMYG